MSASFLSALRSGPPPPKVALLPDALFFTRSVTVTVGATPAEAASQIELALEAVSPFPLAQLYYGWFWTPGSERAFVYAAYRRRFTAEQTAAWADAELVLPVSAALLGAEVKPATTAIIAAPDGVTAVYWETPAAPAKVLFRPLDPEATDEDSARIREELIAAMGGSKTVVDLAVPPAPDPAKSDREIVFRSDDFVSRLPAVTAAALDVRDKNDLAALRAARKRDVMLWRTVLGCAAAILLLFVLEFALVGGRMWQKTRENRLAANKQQVDFIKDSDKMATSINDLVNKRLLPLEMLSVLVGPDTKRKPADIWFTKIETIDLYTLRVEARTTNTGLISSYKAQLLALPEVQNVEEKILGPQGDSFELIVTFKPDGLKPTTTT
jgi:hypothetical protein